MNPELLKAIRTLMEARKRAAAAGEQISEADAEAFIRQETGGKFGLSDARELLASIDTGISPQNLGRSAAQGVAFNFADEAVGALPEEGVPVIREPITQAAIYATHPAFGILANLLGRVRGGEANQEAMRLREDMFREEHPVADFSAGLLGAVGAGLVLPGSSVVSTAGRSALYGAGSGALAGAGAGETAEERGRNAVVGGTLGGVLGGLIPKAVSGVQRLVSPTARATRRLNRAIEESGGADALRGTAAGFAAANRGDDVMLTDLSRRLQSEMDFAANTNDDVAANFAERIYPRQQEQPTRLMRDIQELAGEPVHPEQRAQELARSRREFAASKAGFEGLRREGIQLNVDELREVLEQPVVRTSWKMAQQTGLIGREVDLGMVYRDPSFQMLQDVKEHLDDAVSAAFRQGRGNLASRLAESRDIVKDHIAKQLERYPDVLREYARRVRLEDAVTDGIAHFAKNDVRALQAHVSRLSAEELAEFRNAMASELVRMLENTKTNRQVANELVNASRSMQEKLRIVFGSKDIFDEFMHRARLEAQMGRSGAALGGSQTARRMAAQGADPIEIGAGAATGGVTGATSAAVSGAARGARASSNRATAGRLGPMLMTQGADNIDEFLRTIGARPASGMPNLGPFQPALGYSISSLFDR